MVGGLAVSLFISLVTPCYQDSTILVTGSHDHGCDYAQA